MSFVRKDSRDKEEGGENISDSYPKMHFFTKMSAEKKTFLKVHIL